ncbi:MAG TPA: molecular chaperone DjiA [Candidatus Angelobacter sp.]|nr:molecular chaperone DjiA [Candidatus Angelobacter sp.]
MSILGAILGGAAGLIALGGPLGALLGAAAGHAIGRLSRRKSATADAAAAPGLEGLDTRAATKQVAFTIAVIALGAKMAKADGIVTRDEVDAFKQVFRVPEEEMKNVARVFDQARNSPLGFEAYAGQVARMFRGQSAVLEELLDGLFHIAKADGQVEPAELDYLRKVAGIFGFGDHDFERIRAEHLGPDKADPYEILGVDRQAGNAEIKAVYRKLVREHHPDRLIAKGVPKEFIDMATGKLATINAAWDKIAKERGIN